jgi:16S rRNA (cytosine1402-N4)-methyltransferase
MSIRIRSFADMQSLFHAPRASRPVFMPDSRRRYRRSLRMSSAPHIPVLLAEMREAMAPARGGVVIDGTFGAGGYSRALLTDDAKTNVIGIDRDPSAIAAGQGLVSEFNGRLRLVQERFSALDEVGEGDAIRGVVLDIGVSSMQLDRAERGFSFRQDGPLDMRMASDGETAADILNQASEERLADIFYHYGEERLARPVARAVVAKRKVEPFRTTRHLAELVASIVHFKPGQIHPATRVFQGLRIAVNDELTELADALHSAERVLAPGGVLAVVTFHSLEDRIVKQFLAARSGKGGGSRYAPIAVTGAATFRIDGKWPVVASEVETAANPRARSAKLRAAIRTSEPARADRETAIDLLAGLPEPKHGKGRR